MFCVIAAVNWWQEVVLNITYYIDMRQEEEGGFLDLFDKLGVGIDTANNNIVVV